MPVSKQASIILNHLLYNITIYHRSGNFHVKNKIHIKDFHGVKLFTNFFLTVTIWTSTWSVLSVSLLPGIRTAMCRWL